MIELTPDEMAKEIWKKLSVYDYVYKWGNYQPVIHIDNTREHCLYHVSCMIRVGGLLKETEKEKYFSYWDKVQDILRSCLGEDFKN